MLHVPISRACSDAPQGPGLPENMDCWWQTTMWRAGELMGPSAEVMAKAHACMKHTARRPDTCGSQKKLDAAR